MIQPSVGLQIWFDLNQALRSTWNQEGQNQGVSSSLLIEILSCGNQGYQKHLSILSIHTHKPSQVKATHSLLVLLSEAQITELVRHLYYSFVFEKLYKFSLFDARSNLINFPFQILTFCLYEAQVINSDFIKL